MTTSVLEKPITDIEIPHIEISEPYPYQDILDWVNMQRALIGASQLDRLVKGNMISTQGCVISRSLCHNNGYIKVSTTSTVIYLYGYNKSLYLQRVFLPSPFLADFILNFDREKYPDLIST